MLPTITITTATYLSVDDEGLFYYISIRIE